MHSVWSSNLLISIVSSLVRHSKGFSGYSLFGYTINNTRKCGKKLMG